MRALSRVLSRVTECVITCLLWSRTSVGKLRKFHAAARGKQNTNKGQRKERLTWNRADDPPTEGEKRQRCDKGNQGCDKRH